MMESVQSPHSYAVAGGGRMPSSVKITATNQPSEKVLERWYSLMLEIAVKSYRKQILEQTQTGKM